MNNYAQLFSYVFLILLVGDFFWHFYLSRRQEKFVESHRTIVPESFSEKISLEQHQKAADYTVIKQKFGRVEMLMGLFLVYTWTIGGGLAWLNQTVIDIGIVGFTADLVFLGLFSLISFLVGLPFSLYSTFIIEQKFGFNKITPKLFIMDLIKSTLISILIGIPIIWMILWLMGQFLNDFWWIWVGTFLLAIQLIALWVYPLFIAPLFNKFSPLNDTELKKIIETLAITCGFRATDIQVMDGSKRSAHGNAYFTGFGKSKKIVFFDTLLEKLSHNEVKAVLAHELGHFALKHIIKRFIPGILMIFASLFLLDWLIKSPWFYQAFSIDNSTHLISLLLFSLVIPPFFSALAPLMSISSRKHEFEADAYAAKHSDAKDLISALLALYRDNASTLTPDPLYSKWHDSHPPASIRIAVLKKQ